MYFNVNQRKDINQHDAISPPPKFKQITTELTRKPKKLNKAFGNNYKEYTRKGSDSLLINQLLRVIRLHLAVLLNANNSEWKTQRAVLNKFVLTTYNNNKQKIFTQSENINIMVDRYNKGHS